MSISLATIRGRMNDIIGDNVTGTSTGDGATDKTTVIDASLAKYPDGYFKDYTLLMEVAAEERMVKEFLSPSGTLIVHYAYTAQVATDKAYELHRYTAAGKKIALNQALYDIDPYIYVPITEIMLGEDYNKTYNVPTSFDTVPSKAWKVIAYTGVTDDLDVNVLKDSTASWETNELVGHLALNVTNNESTLVTSNTATTVTCATFDDGSWGLADEYAIPKNVAWQQLSVEFVYLEHPKALQAAKWQFRTQTYITDDYVIILEGKGHLSQFTTDASTTELTTDQSEVVCYKAIANLYRKYASVVDAQNASRFDTLADEYESRFEYFIRKEQIPRVLKHKVDFSWAKDS